MNNNLLKIIALSVITSSIVFASGWRIPEQSAKSVALSGAYISNSSGADSSYYNPANMSFNENKLQSEISITAINLSSIEYKDNRTSTYDSNSEKENFIMPTIFLSSKIRNGLRYGFSVTAPGGLSKRWEDSFPKTSAEEFSLKIVEFNPTVSYLLQDNLSMAFGLRAIYSEGIVKSDGTSRKDVTGVGTIAGNVKRDMKGDTIEFGYNFALSYNPDSKSNISMTYRSNIDLKEEGKATLSNSDWKVVTATGAAPVGTTIVAAASNDDISTSVTVPLPAVLTLSYLYKFANTTLELGYDRTYWSKYKELDFEYNQALASSILTSAFDNAKAKDWKDTNAFRIGITHKYNNKINLMFGFAKDENPAPTSKIGFELPDSDATLYSFGFDYKLDNKSNIGFGYLFDKKDSRKVDNNDNKIDGEFTNASAQLISLAYRMNF